MPYDRAHGIISDYFYKKAFKAVVVLASNDDVISRRKLKIPITSLIFRSPGRQ